MDAFAKFILGFIGVEFTWVDLSLISLYWKEKKGGKEGKKA